jgi:hypothetical protein
MRADLEVLSHYKSPMDLFLYLPKFSKLDPFTYASLQCSFGKNFVFIIVQCVANKYNLDDVVSLMKVVLHLFDFPKCRRALDISHKHNVRNNVCEKDLRGRQGLNVCFYKFEIDFILYDVLGNEGKLLLTTPTMSPDRVWEGRITQLGHIKTIKSREYQTKYDTPQENTWIFHFIGSNSLPDTIKEIETLTQYPSPDQCNIANWMYILHDHYWTKMFIVYRLLNREQTIERVFGEVTTTETTSSEVEPEGNGVSETSVPESNDTAQDYEHDTNADINAELEIDEREREQEHGREHDTAEDNMKPKRPQEGVITHETTPNPKKVKRDNKQQ